MRVFVLTTGRAASTTFAEACTHINGMTAGHETHKGMVEGRLDYPDNHIESDNRLVWFLGSLDRLYADEQTFYVHLVRDPEKVASSYRERWHITVSVVRAFYHAFLMNRKKPDAETALQACRLFVDTVEDNIRFFLKGRDNWIDVRVESLEEDFFRFMDKAGLQGDRAAISAILNRVSNVSKRKGKRRGLFSRLQARLSSKKLDIS
ncbi:hypothetical protein [Alcanivorax sp. 1008]|uniref:hypothetical protein n=1 Tax=Alcanivorax sp. 1008 TaxID=2816853 RepID=UPI001DDDA8EE|nr:hypothetical protein [Alcanivorax sp. 1008]MCC1495980.1 hypothetical protein [Alcanivorax sp. 1008]